MIKIYYSYELLKKIHFQPSQITRLVWTRADLGFGHFRPRDGFCACDSTASLRRSLRLHRLVIPYPSHIPTHLAANLATDDTRIAQIRQNNRCVPLRGRRSRGPRTSALSVQCRIGSLSMDSTLFRTFIVCFSIRTPARLLLYLSFSLFDLAPTVVPPKPNVAAGVCHRQRPFLLLYFFLGFYSLVSSVLVL